MQKMVNMIGNERLYNAIKALVTGGGDARERVVMACQILQSIRQIELQGELWLRLQKILNNAKRGGAMKNQDGEVIRDAFTCTAQGKRNSTYTKIAENIYRLYVDELTHRQNK
jgi:hypothetical protein